MYREYYELTADPFRLTPDPRFVYAHSSFRKAQAYMQHALEQGDGFLVVTGHSGTGKTTLVEDYLASVRPGNMVTATLTSTLLGVEDLLRMIAYAFGINGEGMDKATLLREIERFLKLQPRALLIIDEAQNLGHEALEEVRLLTNMHFKSRPLLQVFLLGQEELQERLQSSEMEQLRQRLMAACNLESLNLEETRKYILHRLRCAGWRNHPVIETTAFVLIHRFSGGLPRYVSKLCARLFLHGAVEQRDRLDIDDVVSVVQEIKGELLLPLSTAAGPTEGEPLPGMLDLMDARALDKSWMVYLTPEEKDFLGRHPETTLAVPSGTRSPIPDLPADTVPDPVIPEVSTTPDPSIQAPPPPVADNEVIPFRNAVDKLDGDSADTAYTQERSRMPLLDRRGRWILGLGAAAVGLALVLFPLIGDRDGQQQSQSSVPVVSSTEPKTQDVVSRTASAALSGAKSVESGREHIGKLPVSLPVPPTQVSAAVAGGGEAYELSVPQKKDPDILESVTDFNDDVLGTADIEASVFSAAAEVAPERVAAVPVAVHSIGGDDSSPADISPRLDTGAVHTNPEITEGGEIDHRPGRIFFEDEPVAEAEPLDPTPEPIPNAQQAPVSQESGGTEAEAEQSELPAQQVTDVAGPQQQSIPVTKTESNTAPDTAAGVGISQVPGTTLEAAVVSGPGSPVQTETESSTEVEIATIAEKQPEPGIQAEPAEVEENQAPPESVTAAKEQTRIAELLLMGEQALQQDRLRYPSDDNAWQHYQAVLLMEPDNQEAQLGLQRIAGRYGELASTALNRRNYRKSLQYVNRGLGVVENDPRLLSLRRDIERRQAAAAAEKREREAKALAEAEQRSAEEKGSEDAGAVGGFRDFFSSGEAPSGDQLFQNFDR